MRSHQLIPWKKWKNERHQGISSVPPTREWNAAFISIGIHFRSFCLYSLHRSRQELWMGQHFSKSHLSSLVIFLFWSLSGSSVLLPTLGKWQNTIFLQCSACEKYILFTERHLSMLSWGVAQEVDNANTDVICQKVLAGVYRLNASKSYKELLKISPFQTWFPRDGTEEMLCNKINWSARIGGMSVFHFPNLFPMGSKRKFCKLSSWNW